MSYKNQTNSVIEKAEKILEIQNMVRNLGGDAAWTVKRMIEYADGLFTFCPFQVGNTVEIYNKVCINDGSGWSGSRHFLIVGARGEVQSIDYRDGKFEGHVYIYNQTWIDRDGVHRAIENGHTYCLSEDYIRRIR